MNPNLFVTPETGKLLEEARLIKIDDVLFWYYKLKNEPSDDWQVVHNIYAFTDNFKYTYLPAPMLGEILKYRQFGDNEYDCSEMLFEENPAEAFAKYLLQLHKDGKLTIEKPSN
jgi:hypothetical protein